MTYRILSELLALREVGVIDAFKAGYQDAKQRREKVDAKYKKIEDDRVVANKKLATKLSKEQLDLVKQTTIAYLEKFFDDFPFTESTSAIQQQLKTRAQAVASYNIFKGLTRQLTEMVGQMNQAALAQKTISRDQLNKATTIAKKYEVPGARPPAEITKFARNEARFFKRLIVLDQDFQLNEPTFKQLLSQKIKVTELHRQHDAIAALNILLTFMTAELNSHATDIAEVGRRLPADDPNAPDAADRARATQNDGD